MQAVEIGQVPIHVESCACARGADHLAVVVNREGNSVRVAVGREFVDAALFPDDRLKLEHLGGWASQVLRGILRRPGHFAAIVDLVGRTVVASQRGERSHDAVLPHKSQTCIGGRGKPHGFETAEVFPLRVCSGGFSLTHDLAPFIDPKRNTVRPSESGCAKVDLQSPGPEDGVHCAARNGRRATDQAIIPDYEWLSRRPAHRAQVCDGVAWCFATASMASKLLAAIEVAIDFICPSNLSRRGMRLESITERVEFQESTVAL